MQEKIIKILTLILAFVLGVLSIRISVIPKTQDINLLQQTLKKIDLQINSIFGEEVTLRGGAEQQEKILRQLDKLSQQIPSEKDVPKIMDDVITKAARELKIDFQLIEPQPLQAEGNYKRLPLKANFTSNYYDFISYLTQLSELSTIVNIDSLKMSRNLDDPNKIDIELLLSLYVMPYAAGEKIPPGKESVPSAIIIDPFTKKIEIGPEKKMEFKPKKAYNKELKLQGIWKGKEVSAFINGKIVKAGDSINGYTVSQIRGKEVVLTKKGKPYILKVK